MSIPIPDESNDFTQASHDDLEQLPLEAIDSLRIPWDEGKLDRIIGSLREKRNAS